jgi:carboxyl-terminal processing protease
MRDTIGRTAIGGRALGRPQRGLLGRVCTLGLSFLAVACAARTDLPQQDYDQSAASRVFSAGYLDIEQIYIEETDPAELALAGLNQLSELDSDVSVQRSGHQLAMLVDGDSAVFDIPVRADARDWAHLTAEAVHSAQSRSPELAAIDPEELYEAVFDGLLEKLDRFSRYATRDQARDNRASRDGFGGVGVRIQVIETGVRVLDVMENTPAERAGLLANDVITHIDDYPATDLDQRQVVQRLRGPVDSHVRVTIAREGTAPHVLEIVRAHVVPQTVKYHREGNVAVFEVTGFNQSTTKSLQEKIRLADQAIGASIEGIVLDLRGNPGGLLDQAVGVSDIFIGKGPIVSTHGRHPDSHQYFEAEVEDLAEKLPIVILLNGGSASASEIVAAALQDSRRAVVVGSNSYGKGTVQTVLRLPNGGELTLTWARFHAPSGYALNERGVQPDICTSGKSGDVETFLSTVSFHKPSADTTKWDDEPMTPEQIAALRATCPGHELEPELDLEVALELLHNPALYASALGEARLHFAHGVAGQLSTATN